MGKSKSQATADGKHDALYLRVSGRGQDTASQEPDLKRWADSQDGPVVWYRDKFTGKTMDRPGWNKLAKDIEAGKVRKMGWTSRPPPAASWPMCWHRWPHTRPRFAPKGSALVRKWPGPPASTWEGPPESGPPSR